MLVWCQCSGQQTEDGQDNSGDDKPAGDTPPAGTGEDAEQPDDPIKQTGEHTYVLDGIELNTETKTIRFEAVVNQTGQDLPLEVLVCTEMGKTHEALFRTKISPKYLNVAFKLIGCHGGKPRAGVGDPAIPVGSPTEIVVKWTDKEGKERTVEPERWIWNRKTQAAMADTTWTYTGSMFHMNRFMAEATGTIANLFVDPSTLIEPPIDEIDDDEAFGVYEKVVPPEGTAVEFIITALPEKDEEPAEDGEETE
jgi:hypothetical protein